MAWQGSSQIGVTISGADAASLVVDAAGRLHAVFSADYDDHGFPGPQVSVITYTGGSWSEPVLPATRNDAQAVGAALPGGGGKSGRSTRATRSSALWASVWRS